ncbi:MAG: hypothetical protein WA755_15725 [Candidatus Acidiferrales bacterium]
MILPYTLKLFVFCSGLFFLVHGALGIAMRPAAPAAIRVAENMSPRLGARFLFILRVFPVCFALISVLGLCVPSFLLFEPQEYAERVSLFCTGAALLGLAIWVISMFRSSYAVIRSVLYARHARAAGQTTCIPGQTSPVSVLPAGPPIFALAGIVSPRVVFSREVQLALSAQELDAALRHEGAHRISRDNLKRLFLLLAPEVMPFSRCFAALEHGWARLSEWAADDDATGGDPQVALSLAGALIRVARLGAAPRLPLAALLVDESNLSARVNRLLRMEPSSIPPTTLQESHFGRQVLGGATLLIAGGCVAATFWPSALYAVHQLLERMIR